MLDLHSTNRLHGAIEDEIEDNIIAERKNDSINNKEADKITSMEFKENYKELCENSCPYHFQMFGGRDKLPTHVLNVIFGVLFTLLGKSDKSIVFLYDNGKCDHAVIVP